MIVISNRNGKVLNEYKVDLQNTYRYIKKHPSLLAGSVFNVDDIKLYLRHVNHMRRPHPLLDKHGAVRYDEFGMPVLGDGKDVYRLSMSESVFDSLAGVLERAIKQMVKVGRISSRKYQRWIKHATPQTDPRLQKMATDAWLAKALKIADK